MSALETLMQLGAAKLGQGFIISQVDFIKLKQQSDGGFSGRQGNSDLWYTEFALRTLTLLSPRHEIIQQAADWLQKIPPTKNIVDCFSLLNARRLLDLNDLSLSLDVTAFFSFLQQQELSAGGFARPSQDKLSAYQTFIASLCLQLLDKPISKNQIVINEILALQQLDGGFCEQAGDTQAQTSATAAALGALALCDALSEEIAGQALQWLRTMQGADGGFLAHAQAPFGDLLSTFSVLTTFALLGDSKALNLSAIAQFLRQTTCAAGGFKACFIDDAPDMEYTYYGIGCLCLLRAITALS